VARTIDKRKSRYKDRDAADYIRRWRVNQGLTRAAFVNLATQRGIAAGYAPGRVKVSPDALRIVEETGHEPGPRIKFAIGLVIGKRPGQIWKRDALEVFDGPMEIAA
jgi:hypothetical protein